jgi:hypothetical protein
MGNRNENVQLIQLIISAIMIFRQQCHAHGREFRYAPFPPEMATLATNGKNPYPQKTSVELEIGG